MKKSNFFACGMILSVLTAMTISAEIIDEASLSEKNECKRKPSHCCECSGVVSFGLAANSLTYTSSVPGIAGTPTSVDIPVIFGLQGGSGIQFVQGCMPGLPGSGTQFGSIGISSPGIYEFSGFLDVTVSVKAGEHYTFYLAGTPIFSTAPNTSSFQLVSISFTKEIAINGNCLNTVPILSSTGPLGETVTFNSSSTSNFVVKKVAPLPCACPQEACCYKQCHSPR